MLNIVGILDELILRPFSIKPTIEKMNKVKIRPRENFV